MGIHGKSITAHGQCIDLVFPNLPKQQQQATQIAMVLPHKSCTYSKHISKPCIFKAFECTDVSSKLKQSNSIGLNATQWTSDNVECLLIYAEYVECLRMDFECS